MKIKILFYNYKDNNIYFAFSVFGAAACIEEEEGNVVTD